MRVPSRGPIPASRSGPRARGASAELSGMFAPHADIPALAGASARVSGPDGCSYGHVLVAGPVPWRPNAYGRSSTCRVAPAAAQGRGLRRALLTHVLNGRLGLLQPRLARRALYGVVAHERTDRELGERDRRDHRLGWQVLYAQSFQQNNDVRVDDTDRVGRHSRWSRAASTSCRKRRASTAGNWWKRSMSAFAPRRPRATGSRRATGRPFRVIVTRSPPTPGRELNRSGCAGLAPSPRSPVEGIPREPRLSPVETGARRAAGSAPAADPWAPQRRRAYSSSSGAKAVRIAPSPSPPTRPAKNVAPSPTLPIAPPNAPPNAPSKITSTDVLL